ncbi:hypothetical protein [Streptomyces sp. TOR3209]|uniref:hypothetical protein n=1 Tax=Streptomyces sp. TOR3209 TaxID=1073567 RepID=UPI0003189B09|nr:hypothetical protein [Streptomyces sp. TOR3209]
MTQEPSASRHVTQIVRAENGFAYGANGADIHVYVDGQPVYVLYEWRSRLGTGPLPEEGSPSYALRAESGVVPFTGREAELARLRQWRDGGGTAAAVCWLHGPGGQGKSRLAAAFADECAAAGWKVSTALHGGTLLPEPGSQDLRPGDAPGVLLIVDYADRWPVTHLHWLLSNAMLARPDKRTRVLLIGRSLDSWPAIRAEARKRGPVFDMELEPLPPEGQHRIRMFQAARDAYARLRGHHCPDLIGLPASLDGPDFGLTLAVHMAALVGVDAALRGVTPPETMVGLTVYLLDREHSYWALRYGQGTDGRVSARGPTAIPPERMKQAVFLACLVGVRPIWDAQPLLTRIYPGLEARTVLDDHARCYPPPLHGLALQPLYPDRLAEDFVALTLPGHKEAYPKPDWAEQAVVRLLARNPDGTVPVSAASTVTLLAAAGERWPHVGRRHLFPPLLRDPGLAVAAGSPALVSLATDDAAASGVLDALRTCLPEGAHPELDVGMAATTFRWVHHQPAEGPRRAALLIEAARRLGNAGDYERTLALLADLQSLARQHPEHRQLLVSALLLQANALAQGEGRRQEAYGHTREALALLAELENIDDNALRIAETALLNAAVHALKATGDALYADELLTRLIDLLGPPAPGAPAEAEHAIALAQALGYRAEARRLLARGAEAREDAARAVPLARGFALADPAQGSSFLADILYHQALLLADVGRYEEAVLASEEATGVFRRLASFNPAVYGRRLSACLSDAGLLLDRAGRSEEGLRASEEAVSLARRLAGSNILADQEALASALMNLGARLSVRLRDDEAVETTREALRLWTALWETDPAAHAVPRADCLANLRNQLMRARRAREACAVATETTAAYARLTARHPHLYNALDTALLVQARLLEDTGRQTESAALLRRNGLVPPPRYEAIATWYDGIPPDGAELEPGTPSADWAPGDDGEIRLLEALRAHNDLLWAKLISSTQLLLPTLSLRSLLRGAFTNRPPAWPYRRPLPDTAECQVVFTSTATMRIMLGDEWRHQTTDIDGIRRHNRGGLLLYIDPGTPLGVTLTLDEFRCIHDAERYRTRAR